ncbi:hypothetical protein O181_047578 [Austropuccinia psidii MF-1]|uniref:Integrase catalytic domain-containing protein n=1 Tax=Austropuccinia psidii MF-1 TaxID=1389203 RepID=A0A9Q3HJN2_9BASI|nr:hypothetical protein [Austropuccinia psidii MF-1]
MLELPEKIPLFIFDSNKSPSLFITHYTKWIVYLPSFPSFEWDFFIVDSPKGEEMILGYDFLYHFNPIINWNNGLITYHSSNKDPSGIKSSASNALATSVNTVSLIKDVGEDVAISSLHLFRGDMDLPILSFHASLEEQLDEEEEPEEIETVSKVVPPAYHQYLDVISKVKAENCPPHHACDHHIELEGLLPSEALSQFQILKEAFTPAPILSHFNPSPLTILETDSSDHAWSAALSQVNDSGKHPIAFDSCKLLPAELNYEIHDKELLGIVWALKCWRASLLSLSNPFEACWAEFLSEFHFTITYRPSRLANLPDALSCQDNVYPERWVDFISKNPQNFHQIIKQDGIQESTFFLIKVEIFLDLVEQIQKEVWQEKDYQERLKQLARGESVSDYSLEPQAKLLLFKDRVVVPRNEEIQLNIIQQPHDSPLAGHPGEEKTLKLIKRDFYWTGMNQFIQYYVFSCQQCPRNKGIYHKKFELLNPLQIPSGPWNSLSMDSITQLPFSNSLDSILVVVDRFSKMAIFIPTYGTLTALYLAQIATKHVFSKHGLPPSTVSDRGSLCVSSFWAQLYGKTEIVNHILEQYLWMYVSYHQYDWNTWLPLAGFSYNNAEHSSTKQSPFFTIYGRNTSFDSIHISQDSPSGKLSTKLQSAQKTVKEELE